jgi:hypothetical protein
MPNIINDYYDLVVLPDKNLSEQCIDISKKLHNQIDSEGVLGKTVNRPHVSILHLAVKKENLKELKKRLKIFAEKQKPFFLYVSTVVVFQTVLFSEVTPKGIFHKLFKEIFASIEDLLDSDFDYKKIWNYDTKSSEMKKNIDKYKTPFVEKYFIPHISLLHFKNSEDAEKAKKIAKLEKANFRVEKIYLCKLGSHHTCQDIVYEFDLKGSKYDSSSH